MAKPMTFNSLTEAIGVANFIESLIATEYQWIHNRVSWLFISQSFCITAFAILSTSTVTRFVGRRTTAILGLGLPLFGAICCVLVGFAVFSATRVGRDLVNQRHRAVQYINENSPTIIPLSGGGALMEKKWTYWGGELPHWVLPWALCVLWLSLLIW